MKELYDRGTHRYDDIIGMEYPLKSRDLRKHPKMAVEDRAKIFAPFAALKGHEEAIVARQKIVVQKIELSEESKEILDLQLAKIHQKLEAGEHPIIRVVYFQKDKMSADGSGEYIQFTGMVAKFNVTSRLIQIVEKKLSLDDIYKIESDDLDEREL
ncbi:MAG: hypothetical protein PUC65_16860 [Clostridiales bacterium]|nr:hypothetical protein [Clostridiales bacterium]